MPSVSVITLTRNRLPQLKRLVERVVPQLLEGDELVVVDTGSSDGTRSRFLSAPPPRMVFLPHDGSGSWAEIRNFAVRQARGQCIAFLDDDCLPPDDWIERGRGELLDCDAVGAPVWPLGVRRFPDWWHPDMGWIAGLSVPGHATPDAGRVHYPTTANLWVRRAAWVAEPFQELGGTFGSSNAKGYETGREDAEWWARLRRQGYRTRFVTALSVGHAIDPTRLDMSYLRRRAARDGMAWANRQGRRSDVPGLAYEWWRQTFAMLAAPFANLAGGAKLRLHTLQRRREGAAIRELVSRQRRLPPGGVAMATFLALAGALPRMGWHRGKELSRVALRWWIDPRPRNPLPPEEIRRVAVVAFGYLGDLVILQSALRGLREAWPALEIHVAVPPGTGETALRDAPGIHLFAPPQRLRPGTRRATRWLAQWLNRVDADVIVAPYVHRPWGPALTDIRRPPVTVHGFDSDMGQIRQWRMERLGVRVHKNLQHHESVNLCNLFERVGLPCSPLPARIVPEPRAVAAVRENPFYLSSRAVSSGGRLVLLNPDAGTPYKLWNDHSWLRLLDYLLAQSGWRVVINAAVSHPKFEKLARDRPSRVQYLQSRPLCELIAWISLCDAMVTVDAGPQHLAHALDIPSLTLYGPMDERRWRDRFDRPYHRTIRACAFDLTPAEKRDLPENHEVSLIDPYHVFKELLALLAHPRAGGAG